jgi:hypothetical protein
LKNLEIGKLKRPFSLYCLHSQFDIRFAIITNEKTVKMTVIQGGINRVENLKENEGAEWEPSV